MKDQIARNKYSSRRFGKVFGALSSHITLQIALILLVAAFLRFNHVKQPLVDAFSWRQSSTAMIAENFYRTSWNIFYPEVNWTGPGPNYQGRELQTVSYIAALMYTVVGQRDWVGRSVAVAFGLLGIFALYQLIRRIWDEERAILSAAVMAVLPGSIFIERSFLPDAAMVALVTCSLWLLVVYLQTGRLRYLLLAGVIGAWGFCTKIPGLIIGLPMAYAIIAIPGRRQLMKPARLAAIGGFAFLTLVPVISYYLWARHVALTYPPYHFAGEGNWLWDQGLRHWWGEGYFLASLAQRFNDWMWTLPVIVLVSLGLLLPHARDSKKAPWLFHWWMLAGVVFYFIGAKELVTNPWNFHIINPAAAALAGQAIAWIAGLTARTLWKPARLVMPLMLLLLVGLSGQSGLKYMYKAYAEDGYKLGLALQKISKPDDLVVTLANDLGDPVAIYYSKLRGWVFPPARPGLSWNNLPEDDREAIRLFEQLRADGADWLGIVKEQKENIWKDRPRLAEYIERACIIEQANPRWTIYRIRPSEEIANLPQHQ